VGGDLFAGGLSCPSLSNEIFAVEGGFWGRGKVNRIL
jgi:hypothetical protein